LPVGLTHARLMHSRSASQPLLLVHEHSGERQLPTLAEALHETSAQTTPAGPQALAGGVAPLMDPLTPIPLASAAERDQGAQTLTGSAEAAAVNVNDNENGKE